MIKLKSLLKETINSKDWVKVTWPFDPDYAKKAPTVWAKKFGRGTVYLQETTHFDYVSSFGRASDFSYSGCFFNMGVKNVDQAKKILDYKIPAELSNEDHATIQNRIRAMLLPVKKNV